MHSSHERAAAVAHPDTQPRQTVLWIIAILLAVAVTALIVRPDRSLIVQPANADASMLGARGIFAFTGQLDENSYGLFMMDVDSSNVWIYQYQPGSRRLQLVAARSFLFDRYLEDYQNDTPTPQQSKQMLERQRQIKARNSGGGVVSSNAQQPPLHADMPGAVDVFQNTTKVPEPAIGTMSADPAG